MVILKKILKKEYDCCDLICLQLNDFHLAIISTLNKFLNKVFFKMIKFEQFFSVFDITRKTMLERELFVETDVNSQLN